MRTQILTGLIMSGLFVVGFIHVRNSNAASNEWLQNSPICAYDTMDAYAAASVGQGAVEHVLSAEDAAAMLRLYHGYRNFTEVRLFTVKNSKDGALVFGDAHGCAVWRMFRRLTWISHVLGRDIVHPIESDQPVIDLDGAPVGLDLRG